MRCRHGINFGLRLSPSNSESQLPHRSNSLSSIVLPSNVRLSVVSEPLMKSPEPQVNVDVLLPSFRFRRTNVVPVENAGGNRFVEAQITCPNYISEQEKWRHSYRQVIRNKQSQPFFRPPNCVR